MNNTDKIGWGLVAMWTPVAFLVVSWFEAGLIPNIAMWLAGTVFFLLGSFVVMSTVPPKHKQKRE